MISMILNPPCLEGQFWFERLIDVVEWVFFSVVSLLPLAAALVMLAVSPDWATRLLLHVRDWLLRNARLIAAAIMVLLAASLLRNGISGLAHMS